MRASQTINVWVSGNIAQSLLGDRNQHANMWRWGIGMWCEYYGPRLARMPR